MWPAEHAVSSYLAYHVAIEFLLSLVIFIAVAKATLGRRFVGRAGNLLSITVGASLAVSLTLGMARWGLSLLDLAWLPLGLLVLIVVLIAAWMLRGREVDPATALVVAVAFGGAIAWHSLRAAGVPLPASVGTILFWLGVILVIRLIVGIPGVDRDSRLASFDGKVVLSDRRRAGRKIDMLTSQTVTAGDRDSWLARQLARARYQLRRPLPREAVRQSVNVALSQIDRVETDLSRRLKRIENMAKRLEGADERDYQGLRRWLRRADRSNRPRLSRQMRFEWARAEEEERVYQLAHRGISLTHRVRRSVARAKRCVEVGKHDRAQRWLGLASRRQQSLSGLLEELERYERRLVSIAGEQRNNARGRA